MHARLRQRFGHVTARDLMRSPVITLPEDAPLEEALAVFEDEGISGVPIVDAGLRPVGILTEHDLAHADLPRGRFHERSEWSSDGTTVREWMSPELVSAESSLSLRGLCRLMRRQASDRVLIVERGRLLGIVTTADVVRWLAEHG